MQAHVTRQLGNSPLRYVTFVMPNGTRRGRRLACDIAAIAFLCLIYNATIEPLSVLFMLSSDIQVKYAAAISNDWVNNMQSDHYKNGVILFIRGSGRTGRREWKWEEFWYITAINLPSYFPMNSSNTYPCPFFIPIFLSRPNTLNPKLMS